MSGCVVQGSSSSSQYLLDQVEFSWKWWLLHTTVNDFGEPAIWRPSANIVTPFAKWRWHLYHLVLHDHKYKYHGHKATVQNAEGTQWIFNYWLDEKTIDDGHPPPSLSTRQCRFWFQNKSCIQSNCQLVIISWHREQRHICFFAHCYFHCCLFLPRFALISILLLPTKPAG